MGDNKKETILTDEELMILVQASSQAQKASYCPYSKFPVGAALLCEDSTIVTGCNVENASFGLGICAERVAITKAVSQGKRHFKAIAVITNLQETFGTPCGACRQVMVEFNSSMPVILTKPDLTYQVTTLAELLPMSFTPAMLNDMRPQ